MSSYQAPQTAKITTSTPVTWSDGSLFNGYILFGIALPTDVSGAQWAEVKLLGTRQRLPVWTVLPIVEGQLDQITTLFLTTQLDPPNTRYTAYWFDNTDKLIYPYPSGTKAAAFSIASNPYTITQPTLAAPTLATGAYFPDPQPVVRNAVSFLASTAVEVYLTGTADGVNKVFTIPETSVVLAVIYVDGQKQDPLTYTRTGSTVTFTAAPTAGSSVTALVNLAVTGNDASVLVSTAAATITGTIDGVNRTFIIPGFSTITDMDFYWNGLLLTVTYDYTYTGHTVTILGVNLPNGSDTLTARVWGA